MLEVVQIEKKRERKNNLHVNQFYLVSIMCYENTIIGDLMNLSKVLVNFQEYFQEQFDQSEVY